MSFLDSDENDTPPLSLSFCLKEGKITALCTRCINTEWRKGVGQDNSTKVKLNMCLHMSVIANHIASKGDFSEILAVTGFLSCRVNHSQYIFLP